MTRSLRARFGLAAAGVVGVILVVAGTALVHLYAADQRRDLDASLDRQARNLARGAAVAPEAPDRRGPDASAALTALAPAAEVRLRVLRPGRPPVDVGTGAGTVPARLEGREDGFVTARVDGEPWRFAARRATSADGEVVVQLGRPLDPVQDAIARVRRRALAIGAVALAAALALGWWLGGRIVGPLARLRDAAGAITSTRQLDHRVPEEGPTEVRQLATSVNTMLGRLDASAAEAAAALDASRAFAAAVAHELRTPLTSIQANVEYLVAAPPTGADAGDGDDRAAALAEIASEQARLLDLLDGLRTLSLGDTPTALPRREVDLAELVDERVQVARRRHPGDTVELDVPDGPVPVQAWAHGLTALVDNLVANALAHGRRGAAPVHVRVTLVPGGPGGAGGGGPHRLVVDDDGPGIPPADRARVFGRFERATTATSGSGLGLALVAQQAAMHGGTATAESSPTGGARLTVTLAATPGRDRPVARDGPLDPEGLSPGRSRGG